MGTINLNSFFDALNRHVDHCACSKCLTNKLNQIGEKIDEACLRVAMTNNMLTRIENEQLRLAGAATKGEPLEWKPGRTLW